VYSSVVHYVALSGAESLHFEGACCPPLRSDLIHLQSSSVTSISLIFEVTTVDLNFNTLVFNVIDLDLYLAFLYVCVCVCFGGLGAVLVALIYCCLHILFKPQLD